MAREAGEVVDARLANRVQAAGALATSTPIQYGPDGRPMTGTWADTSGWLSLGGVVALAGKVVPLPGVAAAAAKAGAVIDEALNDQKKDAATPDVPRGYLQAPEPLPMPDISEEKAAVIAHLREQAMNASQAVEENTSGFLHAIWSGDNGGGERTLIKTVLEQTIPAIERVEERDRWIELARYAERDLQAVKGYSYEGRVDELLKATVVQTVKDIPTKVPQLIGNLVGTIVPWWAWVVAGGVVAWKLGLLGGRKAA